MTRLKNGQALQDGWGTAENVASFINLAGQYESQYRGDRLQFGDLSTETGDSHFLGQEKDGDNIPHTIMVVKQI